MTEAHVYVLQAAIGLVDAVPGLVFGDQPDLVHPFFAELARAMSGPLRESGYALVLASSEEDPDVERNEIQTLLNRGMDAILVASCQPKKLRQPIVRTEKTPLILLDRRFDNWKAHFVGSDDVMVGELATRHLIDLGRRRIAHIGGKGTSPSVDRKKGYRRALAAAGLESRKEFVVTRERFEESADLAGYQAMQELLAKKTPPDAVFCYNDLSAIGAMAAAMDARLRVPRDIAFVGCGNLRYAPYLKVPLSSIDQSVGKMGEVAAGLAVRLANQPAAPPEITLIKPILVVRQSTIG